MLWKLTDFEDQIFDLYYQWRYQRLVKSEIVEMDLGPVVVFQQPTPQPDRPSGSGGDCGVKIPIDLDRCLYKNCSKTNCAVPWHKPCCGLDRQDLLEKLKLMIMIVAVVEIIFGFLPSYMVYLRPIEYDALYDTTESMFISKSTFGGLSILAVSGVLLATATTLSLKRLMWTYLMIANVLCIYIFVLAAIKIHLALLLSQKETTLRFNPLKKKELISSGCLLGLFMLLGSVMHFMGNGAVYVYYNFKYIQPTVFNMKP